MNERTREKLFALRQTWNEIFPKTKLFALDVKINHIDNGWPIIDKISVPTPKIHVNPNFFKNKVIIIFFLLFLKTENILFN